MSIAEHIQASLEMPAFVVKSYLNDLTDEQLLVRPMAGAVGQLNHIAWQLGHLIQSEHGHISDLGLGCMPELPKGFADRYTRASASSDRVEDFDSKEDYLRLMDQQRSGTLTVLAALTDEQLMEPSPEKMRYFGPTVGSVFAGEAAHWMMHAGQWAVIRRQLGKPPLF